jgi:hypothetical protein
MEEKEVHPWLEFLVARKKTLIWMTEKMNYSNEQIAYSLSIDEKQVYSIQQAIAEGRF